MTFGAYSAILDVWGSSGSDVFAVGNSGLILHYDGNSWSKMTCGTSSPLEALWGSSGSDVFAVGYAVILHFIPELYSLNVTLYGTGNGIVTSAPEGIHCGTDCTEIITETKTVTLIAAPDSDSIFKGWGGSCTGTAECVFTMYGNMDVTAQFARVYEITASGGSNGNISPSGVIVVEQGRKLTFTITPQDGYYPIIIVDGEQKESAYEYKFSNVSANHNISVTFERTFEDFETGDFSKFPWITGVAVGWVIQHDTIQDGNCAVESPALVDNKKSSLQVALCTEIEMDVSFWLKVSSELDYDFLSFEIDGVEVGRWSGEIDWTKVSYPVRVGAHLFTWTYSKDGNISKGSDAAWVDTIIFPEALVCPSEGGNFYLIPNKKGGAAVIYLQ